MSPAMHDIIQSPHGILLICASVMIGFVIGVAIMALLEWLEARMRARLKRELDMKPRTRSQIIAPETPVQRLVREAEQHEARDRRSA